MEERCTWMDTQIVFREDCDRIVELLRNCHITVPKENRFFIRVDCEQISRNVLSKRAEDFDADLLTPELLAGQEALAYTGSMDFGHTCAGWESIVKLGFFGLRQRVADYAVNAPAEKQAFYDGLLRVWDGILSFLERAAEVARQWGKTEMAESLENLTKRSPENLYEAMQTILAYYRLQMAFDGTVLRTLGRLDSMLYSFYEKDKEAAPALIADFLREVDGYKSTANTPFALGGSDTCGASLANDLTYRFLEGYRAGGTAYVKLHLLCTENMPEDLLKMALDTVREGKNSIVFMNDPRVIASLENQGAEHAHAAAYHVVGCYECGADEELTCSCNARVNLPKALELTLNGGKDMLTGKRIGLANKGNFESFADLQAEFHRQCRYLCRCAMEITDHWERLYPVLHTAPILSATYQSALEKGLDIYSGGARYCNSSLNAIGLATAVDSLTAVRKLVYEDKILSLEQLTEILRTNWADAELLRKRIQTTFPKYGNGDPTVDMLAAETVDCLIQTVSGHPNVKGGTYRLGLFSIDWRWAFGKKTAASADGRLCGAPISQNSGASFGADREGATAHLLSVAALDTSHTPNGTVVDIDLHESAVRGENGLQAMMATLKTYFHLGGFAVQYNVLDSQILRKAKEDPQAYPNLQVRLCGWNVLFSSLSEKEQDEFIARWEHNV